MKINKHYQSLNFHREDSAECSFTGELIFQGSKKPVYDVNLINSNL